MAVLDSKGRAIQRTFRLEHAATPLEVSEEVVSSVDDVSIEWSSQANAITQ